MRIVSLVPAATEIAAALDAEGDLVAVTHDCDFPPAVRALLRVTRSTIPVGARSREIDALVRDAGKRSESTFHLDATALRDARPDVILGQSLCEVCAVTLEQVPHDLPRPPQVIPLDALSLDGVLEDIRRVAEALGRRRQGRRLLAELGERLTRVRDRVSGRRRPRVACLEWLDPLFNGGHWVPEQVEIAGGEDVLGTRGERSREIAFETVVSARADIVVLMPCGFDSDRAVEEAREIVPRLRELEADIFAVDGNAYFSRPGPRLVDGVEILAAILHPDVSGPEPRARRL